MGKCVPGMPCYRTNDLVVYYTYPKGCSTSQPSPYTYPTYSDDLIYAGPNLPYTGINTDDVITEALQKIDIKLNPTVIFDLFIAAIDNNPALKTILCAKIKGCPP